MFPAFAKGGGQKANSDNCRLLHGNKFDLEIGQRTGQVQGMVSIESTCHKEHAKYHCS